ncbi:alpha/beta hydrolase [Aestuariivirga sp.]|uniref:alpha/beta hydrolase n=1 Tax=Aestuariivirga sp. TaxID=2650926 RepID=UPI0039E3F6B2
MTTLQFETAPDGTRLAFREDGGLNPAKTGFFWLGGFKSDMEGAKAETLAALARDTRRPSFRFDYSGHGQSGGLFVDGTISAWLDQAQHMFTHKAGGRRIVVGSSMGGWLTLLLLKRLLAEDVATAKRIAGLVLIAPATDMTQALMWPSLSEDDRAKLKKTGVYQRPSAYGEPYSITAKLLDDGQKHLMMAEGLACPCPVRILQGDADPDVPAAHAVKTFGMLRGSDVTLTLIKGGDHRLSQPGQLALIRETVLRLAERADGISV